MNNLSFIQRNLNVAINGLPASIDKVELKRGWFQIYVNGFSSCHSLPAQYVNQALDGDRFTIKINGSSYKFN